MSVTRMQILLSEEQAQQLRALAQQRHVSISALVREMVERGLQEERELLLAQQEQALEEIRAVHHDLVQAGVQPMSGEEIVEMIRRMREERTNEIVQRILGRD